MSRIDVPTACTWKPWSISARFCLSVACYRGAVHYACLIAVKRLVSVCFHLQPNPNICAVGSARRYAVFSDSATIHMQLASVIARIAFKLTFITIITARMCRTTLDNLLLFKLFFFQNFAIQPNAIILMKSRVFAANVIMAKMWRRMRSHW